ncbi:MAG: hypothetical protein ABI758_05180 [Candidatus Woesebacteria bacterium]
MKLLGKFAVAVFLFTGLFFAMEKTQAFAADNCTLQTNTPANNDYFINPEAVRLSANDVKKDGAPATDGADDYFIHAFDPTVPLSDKFFPLTSSQLSNGNLSVDITSNLASMFNKQSDTVAIFHVQIEREAGVADALVCSTNVRFQKPVAYNCGTPQVGLTRNGDLINVNITVPGGPLNHSQGYAAYIRIPGNPLLAKVPLTFNGEVLTGGIMEKWPDGDYALEVGNGSGSLNTLTDHRNCSTTFNVLKSSLEQDDDPTDNFPIPNPGGAAPAFILCNQAAPPDQVECRKCIGGGDTITDPNSQGYWTAFGCVKTSAEGIVTSFLRIGLGIAGGFVLLSILYGAFLLTTSSGDPTRVKEGQEMVTAAVMGLFFVIFSIIILQFIGVTLLHIPGFGT